LTQFVGHDVINKNTTDLAVRCSTGSVELSYVAINTPLLFSVLMSKNIVTLKSVLGVTHSHRSHTSSYIGVPK